MQAAFELCVRGALADNLIGDFVVLQALVAGKGFFWVKSYIEDAVDFVLHVVLEALRVSVQILLPTVAKKTRLELSFDVFVTCPAAISETSRGRFFSWQGGDDLIECGYHFRYDY